ncbi:cytochrome P450 306a1 isoform X2 [Athalia rosae]|uniref:cytochrome P450 306a1 isoform X2 n=1 Tax=Athalia rosae TaxID=37344 RepID=UPI002033521B|nr:cytochrome P450 306a1 isoform X2 [Athalia rosae]
MVTGEVSLGDLRICDPGYTYGLICAEGDLWREQRRFAVGCLRNLGMVKLGIKKKIKMETRLQTAVDESIAKLLTRSNDGVGVDPHHTLLHCMGNVMNSIVFGKVFEEDDKTWKWLQSLQEDGVKHIGIAGPLNFLPFLRWLPRYKKMMRFLIEGKVKTHEIYAGMSREDNTECVLSAFDEEVERRRENGEPNGHFDQPQKMHLLADLFGAGTDTTLTTLRWLLLFLAVHPQEQKNIHDEITTVLKGKTIELEDRKVLPYLEAAIAETQRIRSVVPIGIPHGALEDSEIGGYLIPKGSMVVPLQWAIHMDPEYWENPDDFKPSRFISKDGSFAKRDNFLPFQSGKRVCLGIELAGMMLFIFAGRILQDCKISLPPDVTVELSGDCGITLTPKPHRLIFTPRH